MLSSLIRWKHEYAYKTVTDTTDLRSMKRYKRISVEPSHQDWLFVQGHVIDGRNLFPATGFMCCIWELFASINQSQMNDFSVVFQDVKFIRAVNLPKDGEVCLDICILPSSGDFEVTFYY